MRIHPSWGPPEDSPAIGRRLEHGSLVRGVAIDAAGRWLVSSCADGTVWLWQVRDGVGHPIARPGPSANAVAIAPDGRRAVAAHEDGRLSVWDLVSGRPTATLAGHCAPATKVRMTAEGRALSASRNDGCLILWDLDEGRELRRHPSPPEDGSGQVHSIALTGDGRRAVSGSSFGVAVWDLEEGVRRAFWNTGAPGSWGVCTIDGDRTAVVARSGGDLDLWDIDAPTQWGPATAPRTIAVGGTLWGVVSAGPGRVAVATDRGRAELWDVRAGTRLAAVLAHGGAAIDIAASADGGVVATASWDETVAMLDLAGP